MRVEQALAALRKGQPIVLYDSENREGEADLIFHASAITPQQIAYLRQNAGGSIVLAIGKEVAKELQLPFLHDLFKAAGIPNTYVRTNYNDTPPYTIPINHVDAHTGVTDNDKALAICEFSALLSQRNARRRFLQLFRAPGHLPICVSKGIENRRGHTELACALAHRAGMPECMVLCEMLGVGRALSKTQAQAFARRNQLIFLEGREIQ